MELASIHFEKEYMQCSSYNEITKNCHLQHYQQSFFNPHSKSLGSHSHKNSSLYFSTLQQPLYILYSTLESQLHSLSLASKKLAIEDGNVRSR